MAAPLLKRTLSRFRTKTGPRPRDITPDAPPTLPLHPHLRPPCTNQSAAPAHSSHNAPGHEAGPGLSRTPDSSSLCAPKSCSGPSPGPVLGLGPDRGLSPGLSLCPGLGPAPVRSPRRLSYLQSLDRSSRAWVLSDHAHAPPPEPRGEGLIWYNPIPEEEEGLEGRGAGTGDKGAGTEEQTEVLNTESKTEAKVTPEHSGGVSERMIDRLRSPALKLRRKLSLKSRRERHGNSSQDTPPTAQDTPPQDSSSPSRKRPIRRQHSGRRGRHSDDEDLSPWQQVTLQQGEEPSPHGPTHSLTGVLTVHLQRLDLPTHRLGVSRCVSVVIQVDDVIRARTAAMTMTGPTLRLDHAFHLQLERAQKLRVLLLTRVSPDPQVKTISRTRLCAAGGASLASVFTGSQTQDVALALEPRGTLLLRLSLQAGEEAGGGAQVFGAELTDLVQRESSEKPVPLILQKTVSEINRRGLKVQGVYRLCGSSSLKKQLRDGFESDSSSVELQECPDLHAVTGVLKDYLRELPSPLITPSLYEAVKEVMTSDPCVTPDPVQLLHCLPPAHRATLSYLMDHLSLVSSFSALNKMSAQNLAVCFGAVLFAAVQTDQWEHGAAERSLSVHGVDFKQHIEALHFLLSHWPAPPLHDPQEKEGGARDRSPEAEGGARDRSREAEGGVRDRSCEAEGGASPEHRCRGRDLIHRQAGDWSCYQQRAPGLVEEEVLDLEAPFNCRLSLKDFDLLIQDFHRQLNQV